MAAGLLEMVAALAGHDEMAARAPTLRRELLAAGERDLVSYEPVLAALRLRSDDPERGRELKRALSSASEAPLAIAHAAAEVAELAAQMTSVSTAALKGDATAGVLIAEAATRAAARLVEINLRGEPKDPRLEEVAKLNQQAARAREVALADFDRG